jgi:hypothetical protein
MSGKKQKYLAIAGIMIMLFISAFSSISSAAANGSWTGDPDPYDCNTFTDCYWTVIVCINGFTYEVGIYYDPSTETKEYMEEDALYWSGIKLTIGKCEFSITGRWVHSYIGKTWTCNLVSEAGEDKHAPRFSNLEYVKSACGTHPLFGPFEGTADYKLCREKYANGKYFCGNHYDTSY